MSNEITVVNSDYTEGYYVEGYPDDPYSSGSIAGTGKITSEVTGSLRAQVLQRRGLEDKGQVVSIEEDHWDSGYCVTCSYEEIDFRILIGDEEVYNSRGSEGRWEADRTVFAQLNWWLTHPEEER